MASTVYIIPSMDSVVLEQPLLHENLYERRGEFPADLLLTAREDWAEDRVVTKSFELHRAFLSLRCDFFMAQLGSSGMRETKEREVQLTIPRDTLSVLPRLLHYFYTGVLCFDRTNFRELLLLHRLIDFLHLTTTLPLQCILATCLFKKVANSSSLCGSDAHLLAAQGLLRVSAFRALVHECVAEQDHALGSVLLALAFSALTPDKSDNVVKVGALLDVMDDSNDYSFIAALLDLLYCTKDDEEEARVLCAAALLAGPAFETLAEVLELSLRRFVLLLAFIPPGEVSENQFCEMVMAYLDHRRGAGAPLDASEEERLWGMVDETAVTSDYFEHRLLPRLPAQRRAAVLPFVHALALMPWVYDARFSVSMLSYGELPPCMACSNGHRISLVGLTFLIDRRKKCPVCSSTLLKVDLGLAKDSAFAKRLFQLKNRKEGLMRGAAEWAETLPREEGGRSVTAMCTGSESASNAAPKVAPKGKKRKAAAPPLPLIPASTSSSSFSSDHVLLRVVFGGDFAAATYMGECSLKTTMETIIKEWYCKTRAACSRPTDFRVAVFQTVPDGRSELQFKSSDTLATYVKAFPELLRDRLMDFHIILGANPGRGMVARS